MPVRKGKDAERIPIYWGQKSVKINGKQTKVNLVSYVQKGIFDDLGIKASKRKDAVSGIKKNSKGYNIVTNRRRSIGNKYVLVSFGKKKTYKRRGRTISVDQYYRVRVPELASQDQILKTLEEGGKVVKFKYPKGEVVTIKIASGT